MGLLPFGLAAKAATGMATSKDGRKALIWLIVTPVLVVLLLSCYVTYLLASPVRVLWEWVTGDAERKLVNEIRTVHADVVQLQQGPIEIIGLYALPAKGEVGNALGCVFIQYTSARRCTTALISEPHVMPLFRR